MVSYEYCHLDFRRAAWLGSHLILGHGIINITLLLLLHSHFSAILVSIICKKNLKLLFLFINNISQRRVYHNWAFGVVDTSIRVFKSHLMLPFWKNCILSERTDSYKLFSLCYSFQILNYAVSLQVIAFCWYEHCYVSFSFIQPQTPGFLASLEYYFFNWWTI